MTDLAKLVVRLEVETAKYQSELEKAKRKLSGFETDTNAIAKRIGSGIGLAVTGAAVGFAALVKQSIDAADQLNKLSQQTAVGAESLSKLQYAAGLSDVEDLGGALIKLNKSIAEAASGSKTQSEAFSALGVSVRDAGGNVRSTEAILYDVADAFAGAEDSAGKTAISMELFGKSGAALIPLLNGGAAGLKKAGDEAERFGLVIDQKTAAAAEEFNDNLARMQKMAAGVGTKIAAELLPHLERLSAMFLQNAQDADAVSRASEGIGIAIRGTVVLVTALSNALQVGGKSLGAYWAALTNLASFNFKGAFEVGKAYFGDVAQDVRDVGDAYSAMFGDVKKQADQLAGYVDMNAFFAANKPNNSLGLPSGEGGGKAARDETKAIEQQIEALAEQAATLGLNERAMTLWKLASDGASDSQIELAGRLLDNIESFKMSEEATRKYKEEQKELDALAQKYAGTLDGLSEKQQAFNATFDDLNLLLDSGKISWDQYNAVIDKAQRELDETGKKAEETGKTLSAFAEEAARNAQDAFADFLFDPFDKGLSGMLQSFAETVRRMAAEAASAEIFDALMPKGGKGGLDFGALIGGAASLFGGGTSAGTSGLVPQLDYSIDPASLFATRAMGGPINAGEPYWVGEQGPELVVPSASGTVMTHEESMRMSRGSTINQYITTPDADSFRRSKRQIAREFRRAAEV